MLSNAEEEMRKLKKQGYDARVRPPSKGSKLYLVIVGQKGKKSECLQLKNQLRKKGYRGAWIGSFKESK